MPTATHKLQYIAAHNILLQWRSTVIKQSQAQQLQLLTYYQFTHRAVHKVLTPTLHCQHHLYYYRQLFAAASAAAVGVNSSSTQLSTRAALLMVWQLSSASTVLLVAPTAQVS
jgi:hypothetical protein